MSARSPTHITYHYERWRAVSAGILETAGTTFLLLIAVRSFQAGAVAKGLVASSGSVGLLMTPWVVSAVGKLGWNTSKAAAFFAAVGAFSFFAAAVLPFLPVFILCGVVGMAVSSAMIPLLTQMYQENYPERQRGKLFSRSVMIRVGMAAVFSQLAGSLLSGHMGRFPWLLLVFSGASAFSSYCLSRSPSRPLSAAEGSHFFRAFQYLKKDRIFRRTLMSWMLMGFANLMMLPLRVEYLANPKYNLALNAAAIAFLTGVVPNLMRLVLSPVWGWFFDRLNFFALRVVLNLGFALGILTFFTGRSMEGLILGGMIFGISNAGGDIAWSLWVTKFAPPDRVADYMSIHTFFTGLRGLAAPLLAFQLVAGYSIQALGAVSAAMIVLASLMLIPEIRFGKRDRKATALVEEISE